jgi:hypothetical protein
MSEFSKQYIESFSWRDYHGMDDVVLQEIPHIFEHAKTYGLESIETEFKFGKISKSRFDRVRNALIETSDKFPFPVVFSHSMTTRDEYNGTDARRTTTSSGEEVTLYKKRLRTINLGDGITLCTSLERIGQPETTRPYTIYRIKHRDTFLALDGCLRVDLTRVETNDQKYADTDDYLYEVEIEIDGSSPMVFFYTLEHIMRVALRLMEHVKRLE